MNNIFDEATRAGMEASAKALKPCPFCGGRCFALHQETNADGEFMMYIECLSCEARGSVKRFPKAQFADIKSTWNDRADNFLDDYIFRGGALREWVEKIERGEIRAERHGRWIDMGGDYARKFKCSACGVERYAITTSIRKPIFNFCPFCGARMKKEVEE